MNMHFGNEQNPVRTNALIQALDNTGVRMFMFYPQTKRVIISDEARAFYRCKQIYENMPYSFAEEFVYAGDYSAFYDMYQKICVGEKTSSAIFHSKDLSYCAKVTLTTVSWTEDRRPLEVIGLAEDRSETYSREKLISQLKMELASHSLDNEDDTLKVIAASIGSQYFAVYFICMETHTYSCFHSKKDSLLSEINEKGIFEPAWDIYVKNYIVPEDQAVMHQFSNFEILKERLHVHQTFSYTFRRKEVGWTRGTFIAGKRDEEGNVISVIYTVADINAEIEQEEKQKQAVYEAEHDSLTGIYNRKGFDAVLAMENLKKGKVGFAILDIDNFKALNDHFGHVTGDQVLAAVADQLTAVFYQEDAIARIGGDEFAILLRNCDADAWKRICNKLHTVHMTLANCFSKTLGWSITLSAGISFSEEGYNQQMYQLADEGLYETKRLGRAGCTLVSPDHHILDHWQEETISLFARNVLEYNSTGICQIEISADPQKPRRLICGDIEKSLMGIPKSATPEKCYELWRDRIDPSYRETLLQTEQSMIENGQTECTFMWKHPDHGTIYLRCGGVGEKKDGKILLSGYCHPLVNTHIIERQDDRVQVLRALTNTFVASYYLDFENNTAYAFNLSQSDNHVVRDENTPSELIKDYIAVVVDPRDRDIMKDFLNLETLQERLENERFLDAEYRSPFVEAWCRSRLIPVKYDKNGKVSHVLLTATILDSGKFKEVYTLDYNRRSLAALFDNLPCGIIMYEWNGNAVRAVHISQYYKEHSGYMFIKNDDDNNLHLNFKCIHPDDADNCHNIIMHALKEEKEIHHEYRIWDEKSGSYIWERIDAAISADQQKNVKIIYAVYTDITQRKEQELRLEKSHVSLLAALDASDQLCYEYDPLEKTGECLTEDNFLDMPKFIENYPDSLKDMEIFYPDDADTFIETAHQMDDETDSAQCDVRINKNGSYCWYSCKFNRYFDSEKERNVAILTVVDISLRMETQKMYEERLRSLAAITETTICMSLLNLTKGTYEVVECRDSVRPYVKTSLPLKEYLLYAASNIVGEEDQKKFRDLFDVDNLLQQVEKENTHQQIEYLFKMNEEHYEWIISGIDLIKNPFTGEVTGAVYSRSLQAEKMNQMLLDKTLQQDYLFVAIVFVETDEFYLYNYHNGNYTECMQNYWEIALINADRHCSENVQKELKKIFIKRNVLEHLEHQADYSYSYNGELFGKSVRLEIRFSYADVDHTMLLASMRNITDSVLFEKYRHDSEHDPLTDLYNRKTMLYKCGELLKDHPDDSFVMLHIDMKHFRLFNTFFGDAAGDKLLCDVADLFRWMDEDHDYWAYGRMEADVFAAFFPFNQEVYQKHTKKAIEILKNYRQDFLIEPTIGMYFVTDRDMPIEGMFTRATLAAKMVQPDTPYSTVVYDEEMEKTLKGDQEILSEMQTAVEQEQFQVYLQPKYSLLKCIFKFHFATECKSKF